LALVLLAWLAPTIVAKTSLRDWLLNRAAGDLKGRITTQSASLGWFSPPSIEGLEIFDEESRPLAEIPRVSGNRSLASLLREFPKLGRFRLENPRMHVVFDEHGQTNWEQALAEYLVPREEPSRPIDAGVEVVNGSLSIGDARSQQTWMIEEIQLAADVPADVAEPLALNVSGVIGQGSDPGRFTAALSLYRGEVDRASPGLAPTTPSRPAAESAAAANEVTVQTENLPLAMLETLAGRFDSNIRLSGRLSSTVHCRFDGSGFLGRIAGELDLNARDFVFSAPVLGTDRIQLNRITAAGKIAWQDGRIEIDQLKTESDLGNVSATGTLELGDQSIQDTLASLVHQTYQVNGEIDLARLAGMLPQTLRIREATRILTGNAQVALESRGGAETERKWNGRIEVRNLTATNQTKAFSWKQPILVTVAAEDGPGGPVVKNLECRSDFLELNAQGTPNDFAATAQIDLGRLTDRLGDFVNLSGLRLAGNGQLHLAWKRSPELDFTADGDLDLKNFQLAIPDQRGWTEESLKIALSTSGQTDFTAESRVDKATLEVEAGAGAEADWLAVQLAQPVRGFRPDTPWPVTVEMHGNLAGWPARVGPWVNLDDWRLGGAYQFRGSATGSAESIRLGRTELSVKQLEVLGPGLNLHEAETRLTIAAGHWNLTGRRLELESTTLAGSSLSVRADKISVGMPEGAPFAVTAAATYEGDSGRLQQWLTVDLTSPPSWRLLGRLSGAADVASSGRLTTVRLDTEVANFVATHRSGQRVHEERIRLASRGTYDQDTRTLEFQETELKGRMLSGRVAGRYALGTEKADLQLTGQVDYDLEEISRLLPFFVGSGIYFGGRETATLSYQGPLDPIAAEASLALPWAWADIYGFQIAQGNLKTTLSGGTLQIGPSQLDVSEGRVQLAAQVKLNADPVELLLSPGPLAEQVRVNPRMCANALQYIAPVLAGVTSAEGRFSVALEGGRIPLIGQAAKTGPADGEVAGRMTVHGIRVGPGPLVRELAAVLGYESPVEIARESVISFRMVDGRVYHRDLELVFPDLTIRTYGSAGVAAADRSLAMVAEMPIPPKWLGKNVQVNSALRNQVIRLPIGGTLEKPRIDQRELERLSRQFVESAARNVIEDEVSKGLQRLFGPKQ
jgi:hypothetical protein